MTPTVDEATFNSFACYQNLLLDFASLAKRMIVLQDPRSSSNCQWSVSSSLMALVSNVAKNGCECSFRMGLTRRFCSEHCSPR